MKILYGIFALLFILYLLLPNPSFPTPIVGALQSQEPADKETPLRRAYYTDETRDEVIGHYKKQLNTSSLGNIRFPIYRLNYPPEEAQTIIRDQTKSTFLEEIVHPFRESFFVNGFEPKEAKDAIFVGGKAWRQKITVKLVPSRLLSRLLVVTLGLITLWLIALELKDAFSSFFVRKR